MLARSVVVAACLSAGLAACGTNGGDGADGGTVKIGVLAPMTGPLAPYGEALERGMEVAVKLINEDGGIGGQQVEFVLEDSQTDPKAAATQARKLAIQDRVDILMGTISSAETLAVIPQAEAAGVPFMYVIEGEAKTCAEGGESAREYVFGNGVTPEQKLAEYAPYLVENVGEDIYFIGSDYVFPRFVNDVATQAVEDAGGSVAGVDYAPLGTTEFSSYIAKIQKADPDAIFIDVVGSDGVALVKQLQQFGLSDDIKLTGFPTFAAETLSGIAAVAQGVYTVDPYWEGVENSVNEKFVAAYHDAYGTDTPVPPVAAQGAYGSLLLLQEAAEKSGSVEGDKIVEALPGVTVDSPAGPITVEDNHTVTSPLYLLQVEGTGYELVEELGSVAHPDFLGCSSGDL